MDVTQTPTADWDRLAADAGFRCWPIDESELLMRPQHNGQPFRVRSWCQSPLELEGKSTHFGYVHSGTATLRCSSGRFDLKPGMYFSAAGSVHLRGTGTGQVISQPDYQGIFQLGGPAESSGRL